MTPKMQRRLVPDVLARVPADLPIRFPKRFGVACSFPTAARRSNETHFPRPAPADRLNEFQNPGADPLDLRGVLSVSAGSDDAEARGGARIKPRTIQVDDRIREFGTAILPFRLTEGQRQR